MDKKYYYGSEGEQFAFFRIPKLLMTDERFKAISLEAKVLYGLILDRMSLSKANGCIDEQNRVYVFYTVDSVQEDIGCCRRKAVEYIQQLVKMELIETKRQGLGMASRIYPLNFAYCEQNSGAEKELQEVHEGNLSEENTKKELQEVHKKNHRGAQKELDRCIKGTPEVHKRNSNKTEINKTEINKTERNETEREEPVPAPSRDEFDYQEVVDMFHEICPTLPRVDTSDRFVNDHNRAVIAVTVAQLKLEGKYPESMGTMEIMRDLFTKVQASDFLTGRNGKWLKCRFDWIIAEINAAGICLGRYTTYRKNEGGGYGYENTRDSDGCRDRGDRDDGSGAGDVYANKALELIRRRKESEGIV